MLSDNTGGQFALISPEAAHGVFQRPKTQGQVDLSLVTAEEMKVLERPSQFPDINIIEPLCLEISKM